LGKVLGRKLNRAGKRDIAEAASVMRKKLHVDAMLVTMGAQGMMLIDGHREEFIPTAAKEVFDVSGAGDTVVATMAACICSGRSVSEAAIIANRAAGIVVGKVGTSPITLKELEV
jgi:D-beta-D-heptose 7-phosphate kinase/D-beta-D-heptose 1-phosphate adenosyltransferase